MKIKFGSVKLIILASFLAISCQKSNRNLYPETLVGGFELLAPEKTGIDFNNTITERIDFNHFYFSQIYSGAGVAIGDINNDDLPDIFFCGNQVSDRLYLNNGNFNFKNITKKSKIAVNSGWSWGVTMADVNNDGFLDIYISRNGDSMNPEDRRNQLFINNQDLTFTESAMKYGLADVGFSTQAVFFDMDNDGDLDMFQVNQPPDAKLFLRYNIKEDIYKYFTDKLYLNDNGRYKDVSRMAGISQNPSSYGLSVSASDFNNDGFIDLYVANDYGEPDFMYYNKGDGTFSNVINDKMKHISHLSMGSDAGDVNNDGLIDLITIDMTSDDHYRSKTNMQPMNSELFNSMVQNGKHHQYMANALQINSGYGSFYDVSNMAKIARTDWSWSALLVDLDNSGFKDIIISNGIKKDVLNNDYLTTVNNLDENISAEEFYQVSKMAPSVPLSNYAFKNNGDLDFSNLTKDWGFDTPGFTSGMAYGDLDNDGDLDVVTNNMEAPAFVYENKATGNFLKIKLEGSDRNKFGYGVKAVIHHNGKKQISHNTVTRGYFSSVEPGLFFGLGKDTNIEKLEVVWPDGKKNIYKNVKANINIIASHSKAKLEPSFALSESKIFKKLSNSVIPFKHKENDFDEYKEEVLLPHNISQNGPYSAVGDVDGDGLDDLFIGGAVNQSGVLYLQKKGGGFNISSSQPWESNKDSEDLGCLFFDADEDNDLDLYITSGGSELNGGNPLLKDRLYINNGRGEFTDNSKGLPNIYESSQCVKASDIDQDGDLDLFVGTRLIARKYPFPATSYILINDNGIFTKASTKIASGLDNLGLVTDAVFTDIDGDNDEDLIIVGEWMKITIFENNDGIFINETEKHELQDTRGLWWSITASDLDNDGDDDYIIGNLGTNNKFKASKEHPFKVYANDFDNNGTNDIVLAKFYKDDYVPVRGRECTSQQMPFVANKFKDFNSFASSKLVDILPQENFNDGVVYEINNFESIILINDDGKFIRKRLPVQTQVSPIKSSVVLDFNKDGYQDIITVGNHYGVEVETTRYDAGTGALLLGDGKNNFSFAPPIISGFYTPNDSRDVNLVKMENESLIVVTNNNAPVSIFSFKK